jgi:hypothetical protein
MTIIINIKPKQIDEQQTETFSTHPPVSIVSDPTVEQSMRIIEISGTLDFWDDPSEDIYSLEDGEPLC